MEQIYEQQVVPRIPWDGIVQAQRDFEAYRKMSLALQINMSSAFGQAVSNAERRAQQVMTRIQAKVREGNTKRNVLGIMLDG